MNLAAPHHLAVFLAVIASQALGFLWYGVIFHKSWLKAWNLKVKNIKKKDPSPFIMSIIASFLFAYTADYLMRHLGWAGAGGGLRAALYLFIGAQAMFLATHYYFAQVGKKALILDLGSGILTALGMGLVLGLMS